MEVCTLVWCMYRCQNARVHVGCWSDGWVEHGALCVINLFCPSPRHSRLAACSDSKCSPVPLPLALAVWSRGSFKAKSIKSKPRSNSQKQTPHQTKHTRSLSLNMCKTKTFSTSLYTQFLQQFNYKIHYKSQRWFLWSLTAAVGLSKFLVTGEGILLIRRLSIGVCEHDQGIHYACGQQPNGMKWSKHQPTSLQGSVLKFQGLSRSLSARRSLSCVLYCLRFPVVLKENRPESKCGAKSQRCYCALELTFGLVSFTSCVYA